MAYKIRWDFRLRLSTLQHTIHVYQIEPENFFKQLQSGKLSTNNTCDIEIKKTVHDLKGQLDIGVDNEQPCQGG